MGAHVQCKCSSFPGRCLLGDVGQPYSLSFAIFEVFDDHGFFLLY